MAQVACDCLLLLCDKADVLLEQYADVPAKIIQVIIAIILLRFYKKKILIRYFKISVYQRHLRERYEERKKML